MTLEEAKKLCQKIIEENGLTHWDSHEEAAEGRLKFVHFTAHFKIDPEQDKGVGKKA